MQVCKNCGWLFAVTGHGGTEYYDRPFDERGRTLKRDWGVSGLGKEQERGQGVQDLPAGVQEAVCLDQGR